MQQIKPENLSHVIIWLLLLQHVALAQSVHETDIGIGTKL